MPFLTSAMTSGLAWSKFSAWFNTEPHLHLWHRETYPSLSLSLSLHLTAIFPGEPRLASFTGAKDDGSGGDNWSLKS